MSISAGAFWLTSASNQEILLGLAFAALGLAASLVVVNWALQNLEFREVKSKAVFPLESALETEILTTGPLLRLISRSGPPGVDAMIAARPKARLHDLFQAHLQQFRFNPTEIPSTASRIEAILVDVERQFDRALHFVPRKQMRPLYTQLKETRRKLKKFEERDEMAGKGGTVAIGVVLLSASELHDALGTLYSSIKALRADCD